MSISGLGVPATPPVSGASSENRVRPAAQPESQLAQPLKALTASDRELIFQVTGERITGDSELAPEFAFEIAYNRQNGQLAPGQDVSEVFLKKVSEMYEKIGDTNPILPYLDKAIDYLNSQKGNKFDLNG